MRSEHWLVNSKFNHMTDAEFLIIVLPWLKSNLNLHDLLT